MVCITASMLGTVACGGTTADDEAVAPSVDVTTTSDSPLGTIFSSTDTGSIGPATSPTQSGTEQSGTTETVGDAKKALIERIVTRSTEAVGDGDPPDGSGTATVRIIAADGTVCEVCMWLADTTTLRNTGLMGVRDLGGPVGMAFAYPNPSTNNFLMFNAPTPLSIAWFDGTGAYLGEADMDPCLVDDSDECPRYNLGVRYRLAIEMFRDESGASQLDLIGIGPGSTAEIIASFPLGTEPVSGSPCAELR